MSGLACPTSDQRLLLFHWARNFTLIAQYWWVPGTYLSMIYQNIIACFKI